MPDGDYLKLGFSKSFAWSSINNFPDQMGDYEVDQDDGVWIKVPALGSGISKGTISVVHDNIIILDL
ncbi:MAG: hypothetical protein M5U34_19205 [Chloroflexi bacterium]|nr:hypothetical protein [Chloroflexota bacterium]